MKSSIAIAQEAGLRPISDIGASLGLHESELEMWGRAKAKVTLAALKRVSGRARGKLVLVTTMTPTPQGEGKTTTTIGLAQGLARLGKRASLAVREPSIGPVMGMKGGAAGGGYSQILPMEDINLHFTGDLHAVASAHNLLAAMVNNSLHHGNPHGIDPRRMLWHRVLDVNDRALRHIVVGMGGREGGVPHEDSFATTAASEVMAALGLCRGMGDLKERLGRMFVAWGAEGRPVTVADLKAVGAMAILLKDAIKPNLVQTIEGVPAFVHGGPFANIAHGTSSLLATLMGLHLADYFVVEAGFGSDLGAEKFFDIVCPAGDLHPDAAVVVATARAVAAHGLENLEKHIGNIRLFGVPPVVVINRHPGDREEDLKRIGAFCSSKGVPCAVSDAFEKGGEGALSAAEAVVAATAAPSKFRPLYPPTLPLARKIDRIATEIYGASRVVYSVEAERMMERMEGLGLGHLPVCVAKTQYSLSDDPAVAGCPSGFKITVRELMPQAGAGFAVAYTGTITTMPGLPKAPAAERMDIDEEGRITGLF